MAGGCGPEAPSDGVGVAYNSDPIPALGLHAAWYIRRFGERNPVPTLRQCGPSCAIKRRLSGVARNPAHLGYGVRPVSGDGLGDPALLCALDVRAAGYGRATSILTPGASPETVAPACPRSCAGRRGSPARPGPQRQTPRRCASLWQSWRDWRRSGKILSFSPDSAKNGRGAMRPAMSYISAH